MADGVGDDAVSRAHRHRRESEGLSVADLLARHGRDAATPGHRHQQPDDDGDPAGRAGGLGRAPSLAPDGDLAGRAGGLGRAPDGDAAAGSRGRRGSIGPISAPNLPAGPYGGYQADAPAGRYVPDSPGDRFPDNPSEQHGPNALAARYFPDAPGERYVPDSPGERYAPSERYAPDAPAERYVPNDQGERDPLDNPVDRYAMDGPTGRYPLVDRLPRVDPHGYAPTASGPSSPVPLSADEPPSSFAEFDAEPPPDEPRGEAGAIWSSGPAAAAPVGWPEEPEERPAGRADPFRSSDRGRSAITDSRPSSHDSLWSSPNPSTNLFAQLGSAEPDDRPTEVVPRVDGGPAPGNGMPGGPVDGASGAHAGGPAGGVAAAGGAVLGAAAAVGAADGLAGAAGGLAGAAGVAGGLAGAAGVAGGLAGAAGGGAGVAGAALGGDGAAGAAAGTVALGAVAGTAAIRSGRHYRPDAPDQDSADPGADEPASGEQGSAQSPADAPSADRPRPAVGQPDPADKHGIPAHEEYDPGGGAGVAETPAVVNAPPPPLTQDQRTRQIDASLTRLTAIHAGLGAELSQRVSRRADDEEVEAADAAADEPTDDGPPPPRHPTLNRVARIAALVVAVAVFVVAASGWGMQTWLNTKLRPVTALDADAETVVDAAAQRGDRNYLFVGLPPGGREARPATVTLAHLDSARQRLVLVGFPEELVVDRPSCDRWDNTQNSYPGGTTPAAQGIRLFEAYAEGGPRCLTKTVQKLTGLSVNHYTGLDLAALPAMVDAVHGVPLCQALSTSPGPAPESGPTVLAGDKALAFVRGSGDRPAADDANTPAPPPDANDQLAIRHQQVFLAALLNKATSDGVLNSPGELNALVSAFGDASYEHNADLAELTPLAKALHRIEPAKVLVVTAPPSVPSGRPGEVDPGALYAAIRGDKPLPGETIADKLDSGAAKPEPALIPSSIRVTVRNASKRAGLANEAADSLRTLGFVVAGTGDAPASPGGRTIIRYSPDRAKQAAVLGDAVPSAIVEPAPPPPGSSTTSSTDPLDPTDPTGLDEPSAAPTPTPYVGPSVLELVLGDRFDGQVRVAPAPEPSAGASVASLRAATHTAPNCG